MLSVWRLQRRKRKHVETSSRLRHLYISSDSLQILHDIFSHYATVSHQGTFENTIFYFSHIRYWHPNQHWHTPNPAPFCVKLHDLTEARPSPLRAGAVVSSLRLLHNADLSEPGTTEMVVNLCRWLTCPTQTGPPPRRAGWCHRAAHPPCRDVVP